MSLRTAALGYLKRGRVVLPLQPRGKTPVTASGVLEATTEAGVVNNWWTQKPDMNVGIATGKRSGLFVVDIDEEAGEASLRKLEKKHGALPETVEVVTGRGRHLWFRQPESLVIRNSAGKLGEGIDVRGEGGYVVAPPSIHPSGSAYEWSVDTADALADAPEWLIKATSWPAAKPKGKNLEEWHATLTNPIREGQRNDTLASIAGKLLHGGVNLILIHDIVICFNEARCKPPLDIEEIERIVTSVARAHLRNGSDE